MKFLIKNFFITVIFFIGVPTFANAIEIQCRLSDAFDGYVGAILFDYDEENKLLEITKTIGDGAEFMDHPSAWIAEARAKKLKDISNDPNNIWAIANGSYQWEFNLNRKDGSLIVNQIKVQMYWKGRCKKVNRSNKF
jgi:hypothetical protein